MSSVRTAEFAASVFSKASVRASWGSLTPAEDALAMSQRARLRLVVDAEEEVASSRVSSVVMLRTEPHDGGCRCKMMSGLRPTARKDGARTVSSDHGILEERDEEVTPSFHKNPTCRPSDAPGVLEEGIVRERTCVTESSRPVHLMCCSHLRTDAERSSPHAGCGPTLARASRKALCSLTDAEERSVKSSKEYVTRL